MGIEPNRIYIVCTGPSLRDFDFEKLRPYNCLAVNFAIRQIPFAMGCVALDNEFYKQINKYRKLLCQTTSRSDTIFHSVFGYQNLVNKPDWASMRFWTSVKRYGWDSAEGRICHGFNSGYSAVQIACKLGYTDIRILGMDMSSGYYYHGEPSRFNYDQLQFKFEAMKKEMPTGITIRNYSEQSRLTAWERLPLRYAFR